MGYNLKSNAAPIGFMDRSGLSFDKSMESEIHLRLYEELNDFLPPDKRKRRFTCRLPGGADVGKLLEKLGVPRDGVELVLVNGKPADFSYLFKSGDFVGIYPVFESLDVTSLVRLREKPLRSIHFLVGSGLIRLARYLRLLGFDTLDAGAWSIEKIVRICREEHKILLIRDPALMDHAGLERRYLVRETGPKRQLVEVLRRFDLIQCVDKARLQAITAGMPMPEAGNP